MRVAILTVTSAWGGVETHAVHLAVALKRKGHEVKIVELGHDLYQQHVGQTQGIAIQHLSSPCPVDELSFSQSIQLLRQVACDVAVLEKGDLDAANWKFDIAARLLFKRYVTIEQLICAAMPSRDSQRYLGGLFPGFGLWWYRTYWHRFARSLGPHLTICVSEAIRARLVQDYGFSPQKTLTVFNGIAISKYRPNAKARAAARRAWGIPERDIVLGAVGRLAPVKAYDVAISAFKELKTTIGDRGVWLVIVGDGPSRLELEELVRQSGLQDSVKFPGATDQPWDVYPGLDVFIMPSLLEGLPHALLEAMASGCPPIAFNVGGIPEIITEKDMGWLIPDGDREGFLRAMREAASCAPDRLATMGSRARDKVCCQFDANMVLERLSGIIELGPKNYAILNDLNKKKTEQGVLHSLAK